MIDSGMCGRLVVLMLSFIMMGAECELERLNKLESHLIETDEGTLTPMVLPWEVIGDDTIEHREVFYEVLDDMNELFFPLDVFFGDIDDARFDEVDLGSPDDRNGIILVWVGTLPDPDWDEPGPGGVADLTWNSTGEILRADVVIDAEHAYDEETFRARLIHELGHTLGIGHTGQSVDLNSCMSSPPVSGCVITEYEVDLVRDFRSN